MMSDDRERERTELLDVAWGIIANASGGDWKRETPEWQHAASRWRDDYHRHLADSHA